MKNNRPIIPLLLIAAGLMLLIGGIVGIAYLFNGDDSQQASIPDQEIPYPQIARVELSAAKDAFDAGEAVFVDVRDQAYYENGHIPGAQSIPLSQFGQRLNELDPDNWIILYCT
jgi:3-mercaptopyruvate sulfurtransferase SseA